jgi:membrane protease YdiL (CAAX protease family)
MAVSYIWKENAAPMALLLLSLFVIIGWVAVTTPNTQLGLLNAFQISIVYAVFLIVTLIVFMTKYANPDIALSVIDLGPPEKTWLNVGLGVSIGVFVAIMLLSGQVAKLTGYAFTITGALPFLFAGVVAPIIETLFFNGVLMPTFCTYFSTPVGVILASGIFAYYHVNTWGATGLIGILIPFAFALILSFLTLLTQSIAPAIIAHIVVNGIILFSQAPTSSASMSMMLYGVAICSIYRGRCHSTPSPIVSKIIGAIYAVFSFLGLYVMTIWLPLYRTAVLGSIVEVTALGVTMKIPYDVFNVLVPCHLVLLPWTFITALAWATSASWAKGASTWMLLLSLPLTTIENVFSYYLGGSLPVLCICLFDSILDALIQVF